MRPLKRKGHALLTVVGMFAIMSILVVAMINGVMTSYKLTRNSNDRLETFYSADSGLEIAYNELISVVKNAIEVGYEKVESLRNDGPPIDANRNLINTSQEGWENEVFRAEYKAYLENNLEIAVDNVKHNSPIYDKFERDGRIIQVEAKMEEPIKDEASTNDSNAIKKKEQIGVNLKSTFENKDGKSREVEVDYDIVIPDYGIKEIFAKTTGNKNIFSYIVAADGNMDMELDTSFDIYGDMWVQGGEQRDKKDPVSNGLLIRDVGEQSAVTWHGDIGTNGTIEIRDSNFDVPKNDNTDYNFYAKNFKYTGNPKTWAKRNLFSKSPLGEGDAQNNYGLNLHVYNDFIFDGTNTDVNLKSFYGLNDITDNNYLNPDEEPKVASSMIIESEDFGGIDIKTGGTAKTSSNISIGNETAILGTAYLNIAENPFEKNEFFKTGESVVINRHSSPYTYRGYTENEYLYKYKGKLHIIDKFYKNGSYNDLTIVDKVGLVKEFYNKNINLGTEKDKIVGLGKGFKVNENNLLTAGVVYNDGKIIQGHNEKVASTIEEKRKKFSDEVYYMRDSSANIIEQDFKRGKVVNTVGGSFNWDEVRKIVTNGDILDDEGILFDRDDNEHNLKNGGTIFRGHPEKTMVGKVAPGISLPGMNHAKVNVILNYSDNELVLTYGEEVPDEERLDGKIYVDLEPEDIAGVLYMHPTVIISKGDILMKKNKLPPLSNGILPNTPLNLRTLMYTAEDLKFDIEATTSIVGNYFARDTTLNDLFKAFFTNTQGVGRSFTGILGGKQSEEVEKVVNAEDLIKKGEWKLNK
ncbi:MAG: hypothetical protein ACRCWM_12395 [Sarcina sp.]